MTLLLWLAALVLLLSPLGFMWCCCPSPDPGYTIPGCPCTNIPGTIFLHVGNPATGPDVLVFPATFTRRAKPSDLAAYSTDATGYYSTDVFTSADTHYQYRFWFSCSQGIYFAQGLIVPSSPIGYPGRFQIMTWLVGLSGNTCTPFSLHNGASNNSTIKAQDISIDSNGPP